MVRRSTESFQQPVDWGTVLHQHWCKIASFTGEPCFTYPIRDHNARPSCPLRGRRTL